jgi:CTP:molybdopterin cytidylyltransferase MocA/HD superfamily phosphodiesterase
MTAVKFGALIPAAGYSSRMGEFKPLLELGGRTILERQIDLFQQMGIASPVVVAGYRSEDLIPIAEANGARAVLNMNFDDGMFSSVQAGVSVLSSDSIQAFFMLPSDVPLILGFIPGLLMRLFKAREPSIVYACFQGRRGHPPLISSSMIPEILSYNGDGGLRQVLLNHENASVDAETGCEEVLLDMDSPEAYLDIKRRYKERQIPSIAECRRLLTEYNTPEDVQEHSKKVAELALYLSGSLNKRGLALSAPLSERAGLLHDIAKGRPDHAREGARILRLNGYEAIADITARHMNLDYNPAAELREAEIIYLADKLFDGTEVKPLELRKEESLEFKGKTVEIKAAIARRFDAASSIARRIEEIMEEPLIRRMETRGHI